MVKKYFSKKEIIFSIAILTFNEEKTIGLLLNKLKDLIKNFETEIIIIDSGSKDRTHIIIEQFGEKIKNLKLIKNSKRVFNFGTARNLAASLAKGKYIFFISADAIPLTYKIFEFFLEDFESSNKVVAVFGKHIPYPTSSFISKLEITHRFFQLQKYVNENGVFVQNKYSSIYYLQEKFLLYFMSNVFSCYSRSFLIKHPFKKMVGCEDLIIGKEIIDRGFSKIYDSRCVVMHSHNFNYLEYYKQQKMEFLISDSISGAINKLNFFNKLGIIINLEEISIKKIYYFFQFVIYYLIKLIIFIEIRLLKHKV